MSYADNLSDYTKKSIYMAQIECTYVYDDSEVTDLGGNTKEVDYDFGSINYVVLRLLSSISLTNNFSLVEDSGVNPASYFTEIFTPSVSPGEYYHDKSNSKIIYNTGGATQIAPQINFNLSLSTDILRTYSDPIDDSSELIQWIPSIDQIPTIKRDISDFAVGFYPTQISQININSIQENIRRVFYQGIFKNHRFRIYHSLGDYLDVANVKQVFDGTITDVSYNLNRAVISFSDGTNEFDKTIRNPFGDDNYADETAFPVDTVSDQDRLIIRRRIYGVTNAIKAVNIDRSLTPSITNNRVWIFGTYNGDDTKIDDYEVEIDADHGISFTDSFSEDRIQIDVAYSTTATDTEILDAYKEFRISAYDYIKLNVDNYPADTFYLETSRSRLDSTVNNFGGIKEAFRFSIDVKDMFSQIATITGDSVAVVKTKLTTSAAVSIKRSIAPRLYLEDNNRNQYRLDIDLHFTEYRDPVNNVYGITLIDDVESIISTPYTPLTGNETVFGRVYGPRADDVNFGHDSVSNSSVGDNKDFTFSGNNNSLSSVLYDFYTKYMGLSDSEIDIDTFNDRARQEVPTIDSSGATKILKVGLAKRFNFSFPQSLSSSQDTIKQAILNFSKVNGVQIFKNNDGLWTFKLLDDADKPVAASLTDKDFDLVSDEDFDNRDLYGDVRASDNFTEKSTEDNGSNGYRIAYGSSTYATNLANDASTINLIGSNHNDVIRENADIDIGGTSTGEWLGTFIRIFQRRGYFISIKVSGEWFGLDVGDTINVTSNVLTGAATGSVTRKYTILGISESFDSRALKLSDYNSNFADGTYYDPDDFTTFDIDTDVNT